MEYPNRIAHILHDMKIGGVENAARYHLQNTDDNYKIFCLGTADFDYIGKCEPGDVVFRHVTESRLAYGFRLLRELNDFDADLIVSSLWRGHLFSFFFSVVFSKKWVSFFHSSRSFHFLDYISTKLALRYCCTAFCDSKSTESFIKLIRPRAISQLVSFYFKPQLEFIGPWNKRASRASFFGRLSKVKNLTYLFELISLINKNKNLILDVYGVGEDESYLKSYVVANKLEKLIVFKGAISPDLVSKCMSNYKYYFQTSTFEGMAISVVQAMSVKCCCFVTFVGEINNYAIDGVNAVAIPINDVDEAVKKILITIDDHASCYNMSENAYETFSGYDDFSASFEFACRKVILNLEP